MSYFSLYWRIVNWLVGRLLLGGWFINSRWFVFIRILSFRINNVNIWIIFIFCYFFGLRRFFCCIRDNMLIMNFFMGLFFIIRLIRLLRICCCLCCSLVRLFFIDINNRWCWLQVLLLSNIEQLCVGNPRLGIRAMLVAQRSNL